MKRAFDILVSLALLLILSPLFAAIGIGIRFSSPGPVVYRQLRAGKDGCPFTLFKFRSMHNAKTVKTHETWKGDSRVFLLGQFLREYHLDELPQLWNVLAGDMSLVGPRPTLLSQVKRYTSHERGRLKVRPGITGLAQVSGNNELDWNQRIEVDLEYVEHASFLLDLRILWRTLRTVLRKEGVYGADGRVRDKG